MKIYGFGGTRSMRAVWAAKEAGVEFEYISMKLKEAEHHSPEFERMNPNKAVPVLEDGDFILFESSAIITYLGDMVPEKKLVPTEMKERAIYNQWMSFANCELDAPLFNIEKHAWRYSESDREPKVIDLTIQDLKKPIGIIEKHLSQREFVLGDHFSMVDIMMAHCLNWARYREVFQNNEILDNYTKNLSKRESYPRELYKK